MCTTEEARKTLEAVVLFNEELDRMEQAAEGDCAALLRQVERLGREQAAEIRAMRAREKVLNAAGCWELTPEGRALSARIDVLAEKPSLIERCMRLDSFEDTFDRAVGGELGP